MCSCIPCLSSPRLATAEWWQGNLRGTDSTVERCGRASRLDHPLPVPTQTRQVQLTVWAETIPLRSGIGALRRHQDDSSRGRRSSSARQPSCRKKGPSHAKWRSHLSRRGLNSLVIRRVRGSMPAMFGPLCILSCRHDSARLSGDRGTAVLAGDDVVDRERDGGVDGLGHPAILTGIACPLPHDSCQRSVHGSLRYASPGFQGSPGLGVEQGEQMTGLHEIGQLGSFIAR